jgi:DNA-binding NarL/FixJ family response regulator
MQRDAMNDKSVFLSPSGNGLPRWSEAFPLAVTLPSGAEAVIPADACIVWLRLADGQPVTAQIAAIRQKARGRPLVVLSNIPSDDEAVAAFAAGARGYCNAHASADNLRQVAAVVLQGGVWIGESLMQRLLAVTAQHAVPYMERSPGAEQDSLVPLTEREREVAQAVAAGASNKEIARQLDITERTVKAHVSAILEKLGARDRLQLALIVNGRR